MADNKFNFLICANVTNIAENATQLEYTRTDFSLGKISMTFLSDTVDRCSFSVAT